jgi:threonine dehydratase
MPDRPNLDDIRAARERIQPLTYVTPLERSADFSQLLGNSVFHKLENLQLTGSFKVRGALNALLAWSDGDRAKGVVAASAGNHAQGVAFGARQLGVPATIVMPVGTPLVKLMAVKRLGAEVTQTGENYDEAAEYAAGLAGERGAKLIHPFNDPMVIAGQGTIALEILEQMPDIDAVLVAIGGGGLIAGIGTVLKALCPRVQVIGVQAAGADGMARSMAAGQVVGVDHPVTIADGIRVARPGDLTFAIARDVVDQVVTVTDDEIANAVLMMIETDKSVVEGAGATPLAAMLHGHVGLRGKRVALIVSGGNIDVNILSRIIERGLVKTGRLIRIRVTLSDRPGSLSNITRHLAAFGANVLHVNHDRAFSTGRLDESTVEFALETRGNEHASQIVQGLGGEGYFVDVLT